MGDNNGTITAFLSGRVPMIATGNVVAAAILAAQSAQEAGNEVPDQEFAVLHRPEQGTNRSCARRVNDILADGQA